MSYAVADDKVAELKKFRLDFDGVDVKKRPDRFRRAYHELHLIGYNPRTLEDLSESLEENGYKLVDIEEDGFTYYSKDGKTEVYLDRVWNTENQVSKVMMLRGKLSEDDLPLAEQQLRALYNTL